MNIDFGEVEEYFQYRRFGFLSHTFAERANMKVLFHITVVGPTYPEIAQALESTTMTEPIYFWYEYGPSPKGDRALAILDSKQIRTKHAERTAILVERIRQIWMDVESPLPEVLRKATSDLLMSHELNELTAIREALEAEQRLRREEMRKAEDARLKAIADQWAAKAPERQAIADRRAAQERVEEEEFNQLVEEISPLGFTHSNQVSAYIVRNSLGKKYKHISGILQMELDGNVWNFNGGFPPKIFARLCAKLGLSNQGSRAVPGAFTPFKDII